MVTACAYAEAALLNGTTTIFCDSHEIGIVLDAAGITPASAGPGGHRRKCVPSRSSRRRRAKYPTTVMIDNPSRHREAVADTILMAGRMSAQEPIAFGAA